MSFTTRLCGLLQGSATLCAANGQAGRRAVATRAAMPAAGAPLRGQGCYMGDVRVEGAGSGPLAGLTAVVKDSYDVAGARTSNGSPAWAASHPPAAAHAPAVQALLDAGASVVGKNVMAEMAYSLSGENAHYGMPVNPACPGRDPGGSSSGTAAAVAAGDADLGLGGDTGGSVRVPASFCGVLGIRPTHGRVPLAGSVALAPSFDTGGWFARDASVLRAAGAVLLDPGSRRAGALTRWLVATDAFAVAEAETTQAIYGAMAAKCELRLWMDAVREVLGAPTEVEVGTLHGGLAGWVDVFRNCQAHEIWRQHGPWITAARPEFGPGIKERFEMASRVSDAQAEAAAAQRREIRAHLDALLGSDGVLALPTAPGPAHPTDISPEQLEAFRKGLLALTSVAGLAGLPQVSLPIATADGCPVGLGLIGPPGSDEELLALAERLMAVLGPAGS